MSYQFSIWLDDKTANDLEKLSHIEERKRGAMVKVLIRRAARQLLQADSAYTTAQPIADTKRSEGEIYVTD